MPHAGYPEEEWERAGDTQQGAVECVTYISRKLKEANRQARENRARERSHELKVDQGRDGRRRSHGGFYPSAQAG